MRQLQFFRDCSATAMSSVGTALSPMTGGQLLTVLHASAPVLIDVCFACSRVQSVVQHMLGGADRCWAGRRLCSPSSCTPCVVRKSVAEPSRQAVIRHPPFTFSDPSGRRSGEHALSAYISAQEASQQYTRKTPNRVRDGEETQQRNGA